MSFKKIRDANGSAVNEVLMTETADGRLNVAGCYFPIEGGYRIRITDDATAQRFEPGSRIGVVEDAPRDHRRPLFPPGDKSLIWNEDERKLTERCPFRPLVLAHHAPRFLLDLHTAGGLFGYLYAGLRLGNGKSKWFHEWSDIDVSYIDGRLEYKLRDDSFPGMTVLLSIIALADSVGMIMKVAVEGTTDDASMVWAYGGASARFSLYYDNADKALLFSPDKCSKNLLRINGNRFSLTREFCENSSTTTHYSAADWLPGWSPEVHGGGSSDERLGFGNPESFDLTPGDLLETVHWVDQDKSAQERDQVVVRECPASKSQWVVLGMGGNIEQAISDPSAAWAAALERHLGIASRIMIDTPDPYLNAAVTTVAFSTEGIWGDNSILHGGWSWRSAYLGWRAWYGPMCYGWADRVRKSIQNHARLSLVEAGPDKGALRHMLEDSENLYYDMNHVFIDQVRQYFEYTDDTDLMREILPVIESISREERRTRPSDDFLYPRWTA